jgi:hypothetical protein
VKKDIHIANEEEQAKICRKLKKFLSHTVGGYILRATIRAKEAKVPLNYYLRMPRDPRRVRVRTACKRNDKEDAKNPSPGRSPPSPA